jgi:hypothetical protein
MNVDIYYSSNNTTYAPINNTLSNRTGNILRNTATVPDGINYTIKVKATDDFGNNATVSVPFKIDNT